MTDSKKPLILVTGASGSQGGSVIKHLLQDGNFRLRALSRNPNSEKSQALAKQGVEVVQGDLKDRKSLDAALAGADGLFLVTQFWEKCSEEDDFQQGVTAIEAARAAGTKHVLFSTLPGCALLSGIKVPHFDGKWRAALSLIGSGLSYTLFIMPYYAENWTSWFKPNPGPDGKLYMGAPAGGKRWAVGSVGDVGLVAARVFKFPQLWNEKFVELTTELLTSSDTVAIYNKVKGANAIPAELTTEAFAKLGFPGAEELAVMFGYYQWLADKRAAEPANPYVGLGIKTRDYVQLTKQNTPQLTSLEQVFRAHTA